MGAIERAIEDVVVPGSGEILAAAGAAGKGAGILSKLKGGLGGIGSAFSKSSGVAVGAGAAGASAGIRLATSYNTMNIFIALVIAVVFWYVFDKYIGTKTWMTILIVLATLGCLMFIFKPTRKFLLAMVLIFGGPLIFGLTYNYYPDFNPLIMLGIMIFWCIFALIFGAAWFDPEHKNKAGVLFFVFNILIYAVFVLPYTSGFMFAMLAPDSPLKYAAENQQKEWGNIGDKVTGGFKRAQMEAQRQINIASGNYESGVEAQSQKPLGIFLENTGTNSPIKYPGDLNLKIFGYIKAVTPNPQDKFKISSECYGIAFKEKKAKATFYPPGDELSAGDYKSVDCLIPITELSSTTANTQAVLETTFDFKTSAFVKTYFMEQDVIRSYRMQNLDPLDEYKIVDKNPVAIYTGGPLMIGMRAGLLQPVPLVRESSAGPSLDITLDRTAQWPEGELMKINSLTVYAPVGLKIKEKGVYCGQDNDPQKCKIDVDEYAKSEADKPLMLPKTFRFETEVDGDIQKILGGAPLAVHSFKLDAEYTFRIKKTFDVRVIHETGAST